MAMDHSEVVALARKSSIVFSWPGAKEGMDTHMSQLGAPFIRERFDKLSPGLTLTHERMASFKRAGAAVGDSLPMSVSRPTSPGSPKMPMSPMSMSSKPAGNSITNSIAIRKQQDHDLKIMLKKSSVMLGSNSMDYVSDSYRSKFSKKEFNEAMVAMDPSVKADLRAVHYNLGEDSKERLSYDSFQTERQRMEVGGAFTPDSPRTRNCKPTNGFTLGGGPPMHFRTAEMGPAMASSYSSSFKGRLPQPGGGGVIDPRRA